MDKGLCPRCGEEAAPYRLCGKHRFEGRVIRALKRCERLGALTSTGRGMDTYWNIVEGAELDTRWATPINPPEHDKRFRPRLGNVPVDVEKELIQLFIDTGKPMTTEEVMAAWERLRQHRNRESVAADLKRIVKAQRRREERLERNRQRIMGEAQS